MKTYTYFSKGSESVRLHSGDQGMIVMPMPQPPEGNYKLAVNCSGLRDKNHGKFHWLGIDPECEYKTTDTSQPYFKCPLGQPGDIINVKEKFRIIDAIGFGGITVQYLDGETLEIITDSKTWNRWVTEFDEDAEKANRSYDGIDSQPDDNRWRSPVTMPLEAVRTKPVVKKSYPIQCQNVTEEQAKLLVEVFDNSKQNALWPPSEAMYRKYGYDSSWTGSAIESWKTYIIWKYGLDFWESNSWVWCIEVEKQ